MNLNKQLTLLEQCGDPATMDRMMKVFRYMILEAKDNDEFIGILSKLQFSTNLAYSRQTRENLLAFK
jgi:DNA-binding GntR family transcriptional regulator